MSFWDKIRDTDARLEEVSYYELLGVEQRATGDEIGARYYELAGRFHPDRFALRASKADLASLSRIYARLGEARRVLSDVEARASYDRQLREGKLRVDSTVEKRPKLNTQDPASPMARNLYDAGLRELQAGNLAQARAKLALAVQYEPGSTAITAALQELEQRAAARMTPAAVAAPAAATPAPPPKPLSSSMTAATEAPPPRAIPASTPPPPGGHDPLQGPRSHGSRTMTLDIAVAELARLGGLPAHQVLGVVQNATDSVVELAYTALAARFDPATARLGPDPVIGEICRDLMALVARARDEMLKRR